MTPNPRNRIDWPVAIFWLALAVASLAFAYVVAGALLWLAQRLLMAAWPWLSVHGEKLLVALGMAAVISLVVVAAGGE